ncbi:Four helix bundle protein [Gammaproteobacteria bacterium]
MYALKSMPIWRDASQLLVMIEQAVRHFPRYHKYALGTEMRQQAMRVCRLIVRAYHDKENRGVQVQRLNDAVDDLKVQIQLAKELTAFRHFQEFEAIATLTVAVGKQSGGWKRHLPGPTARTGVS